MISKKKMYDQYVNKGKSSYQIAEENNCSSNTILRLLKKHNIPVRPSTNLKDLLGEQFGDLIVIDRAGTRRGRAFWKCQCNCGAIEFIEGYMLRRNKKRCCKKCSRRASAFKLYKGVGQISGRSLSRIKRTAKYKNIAYELEDEYLWELFLKQDKKCALTGIEISVGKEVGTPDQEITASLDRIDNTRGYVKRNVQWLHKDVNAMKSNFNQDYFVKICSLVSPFRGGHGN